ncbi:SDR family NAD(P)-dependent oxidoreductase [Marinomonas gallaica]|uniref:SDR family NAD(P)-dependent oxidoreductase n=1 Tax=Marinomonas gallaica TaxID=1806667 RepID=UPI003CE58CBD
MFSLEGMNALITGGTSGIGLATARRFAAAGARVAIVGRRDATGLAEELNGIFLQADVTNEDQLRACFEAAEARLGKLDIIMNNAGIENSGPTIAEQSADEFQRILDINVKAVYNGLRFAPQHMNDGGSIINTSSDVSKVGYPGYGQYSATKSAVCSLTRVAAMELVPRKIRVNAICPASVWTEMLTPDHPEVLMTERTSPMGRVGHPEEVAALCHFLAAPDCSYLTGQSISVDGGLSAGMAEHTFERLIKD